jgi:hypothetical protein
MVLLVSNRLHSTGSIDAGQAEDVVEHTHRPQTSSLNKDFNCKIPGTQIVL